MKKYLFIIIPLLLLLLLTAGCGLGDLPQKALYSNQQSSSNDEENLNTDVAFADDSGSSNQEKESDEEAQAILDEIKAEMDRQESLEEEDVSGRIFTESAVYGIDVNSYPELVGSADYVFVGHVVKVLSTEYQYVVDVFNEEGYSRTEGEPWTSYEVQIEENLKGSLVTDRTIVVKKVGGTTKDGKNIVMMTNDILPQEGYSYVFFVQAQKDGTILACGTNSSIPLSKEAARVNTLSDDEVQLIDYDIIMNSVRNAVEKPIESDRERYVSADEQK